MTLSRTLTVPQTPAAAAVLLEPVLAEIAGPGADLVSLTLDYGAALPVAGDVRVEASLDRATRTLIFAQARLMSLEGETLLATGSAVFRRQAAPPAVASS
jgi:hypothetical protein